MQEFIKELNNYLKTLGNINISVTEDAVIYQIEIYYEDNQFKAQTTLSIFKELYNRYKNDLGFKLSIVSRIAKYIEYLHYESKEQTTETQVTH